MADINCPPVSSTAPTPITPEAPWCPVPPCPESATTPTDSVESDPVLMCDGGATPFIRWVKMVNGVPDGTFVDKTQAGAPYIPAGVVTFGSCYSGVEFEDLFGCGDGVNSIIRRTTFNTKTGIVISTAWVNPITGAAAAAPATFKPGQCGAVVSVDVEEIFGCGDGVQIVRKTTYNETGDIIDTSFLSVDNQTLLPNPTIFTPGECFEYVVETGCYKFGPGFALFQFPNIATAGDWEYSEDGGNTWGPAPVPAVFFAHPDLASGLARWRTTVNIPYGLGGTFDVFIDGTLSSDPVEFGTLWWDGIVVIPDVWSGSQNQNGPAGGTSTVTLPVTPGAHVLEFREPHREQDYDTLIQPVSADQTNVISVYQQVEALKKINKQNFFIEDIKLHDASGTVILRNPGESYSVGSCDGVFEGPYVTEETFGCGDGSPVIRVTTYNQKNGALYSRIWTDPLTGDELLVAPAVFTAGACAGAAAGTSLDLELVDGCGDGVQVTRVQAYNSGTQVLVATVWQHPVTGVAVAAPVVFIPGSCATAAAAITVTSDHFEVLPGTPWTPANIPAGKVLVGLSYVVLTGTVTTVDATGATSIAGIPAGYTAEWGVENDAEVLIPVASITAAVGGRAIVTMETR